MAHDDASLVKRTLGGDTAAYRELVERYQRAVFSCAYQLLGSRHDAEEAAQEAFVQAFEKLDRLREPRYFFSWVWRITSTVALKWRLKQRRSELGLEADMFAREREQAPVEREEQRLTLLQALAQLPEEQREAITLRFWEEMDYAQMGKLLGISHDALYQRVSRGLKQLRELLGQDFVVRE